MSKVKYWIATISKEHTMRGIAGGFMQVCHGKEAPLKRMRKGDYLLIYSSKITMEGNEKCQAFTAIGRIKDDEVYQFQMSETFKPFRKNIEFLECEETSIIPLIDDLEFIPNKKSWGYPFRFGFFEINENDFNFITSRMLQNQVTFQIPLNQ
ncbi:EVE domain-containing protein [Flavobacterium sp. N3904]|uniref:EVE domain-containing protein n=1 Tax=Flavobacterium sp. N3904 TaxID=2986835 RepID=UPI0022259012|nr:EVE domain-containing protein [Flavobacterium sp. N3904]